MEGSGTPLMILLPGKSHGMGEPGRLQPMGSHRGQTEPQTDRLSNSSSSKRRACQKPFLSGLLEDEALLQKQ